MVVVAETAVEALSTTFQSVSMASHHVRNMLPIISQNVMQPTETTVCRMHSVILQVSLASHVHEVVVAGTVVTESSSHMQEKNVMSDLVTLFRVIADGVVSPVKSMLQEIMSHVRSVLRPILVPILSQDFG